MSDRVRPMEFADHAKNPAPLTPRLLARRDWIARYIARHGYAPTVAEMGAAWGVSGTAAHQSVSRLVARGAARRIPGCARGLILIAPDPDRSIP